MKYQQRSLFQYLEAQNKEKEWDSIRQKALCCQKCALRNKATQVVFGTGNSQGKLFLIGEGPGANEDQQGQPFVGKAGQLLNENLKAIDLRRSDIYISNIVKCRPPNNRQPTSPEIKTCLPWLIKELELVQPHIIMLLGLTALKALIDPQAKITKMRGQWLEYQGIKTMPTFHPAALLRDPRKKNPMQEDFKLVATELKK